MVKTNSSTTNLNRIKLKSPADGGGFFNEYVIVFMEDSILKGWRNEKYQL